jgi:hypothetical protein
VHFGNAVDDGVPRRGWLVGHFLLTDDPRASADVAVKWGIHPAGEQRAAWAVNRRATTLSLLIEGRFRIRFADRAYLLTRPGDYVIWLPGVAHHWHAEAASVVLTVRWPSADDSEDVPPPAGVTEPEA